MTSSREPGMATRPHSLDASFWIHPWRLGTPFERRVVLRRFDLRQWSLDLIRSMWIQCSQERSYRRIASHQTTMPRSSSISSTKRGLRLRRNLRSTRCMSDDLRREPVALVVAVMFMPQFTGQSPKPRVIVTSPGVPFHRHALGFQRARRVKTKSCPFTLASWQVKHV
jgi:hypothetical protein